MKVLVTGSSGLIGSEAVRYFDRRGARVSTGSTTTCGPTSSAPAATPPGPCDTSQETCRGSSTARSTSATAQAMSRDRSRTSAPT